MSLRRLLLAVLIAVPSLAIAKRDPAEDAYQAARRGYYALKGDASRRKLRDHWLRVVDRFEAAASRFSKSGRAPDALFTAAELLNELSRISMLDEDLRRGMGDYQKVAEGYGSSRLGDDAALALARIYSDRLGQPEAALKVLERSASLQKGDRAKEMSALVASIAPGRGLFKRPATSRVQEQRHPEVEVAMAAPSPRISPEAPKRGAAEALKEGFRKAVVSTPEHVSAAVARERLPKVTGETSDAGVTLAEQLGLKVRRVVIDPGHGGHDSGAVGKGGTLEKDVSLELSKKLAEILRADGLEVVLTRDDDRFVRLEDRARIANEARGDLFISIHCNSAASHKLRGIETYTLNTSSDRYSIRLAARENASSERGISDLQFILADLATKANTEESSRLASRVQKAMVGQLGGKYSGIKDLGTKAALFYVLLGTRMPAILVETSFISQEEDEKRLASPEYQADMAKALSQGVQDFLENRSRLARVD